MMPRTLTLIRHGESESNVMKRIAEKGGSHPNESALMEAHTSRRRLTERGIKQAKRAGDWLHNFIREEAARFGERPFKKTRGFVSPYIRAMETAGYLDLPIIWRADPRLVERNWGEMDQLTFEERVAKYGSTDLRERHGMFWPAGNGETLLMVATRIWEYFDMLAREHSEHDIIEVSHGETILAQRFTLERWLPEDVVQMMLSTDERLSKEALGRDGADWQNKIINCRIIQYTREREDGTWGNSYCRVRLIAPSDPDNPQMNLDWQPIIRKEFNSAELLEYVKQFPRYLEDV